MDKKINNDENLKLNKNKVNEKKNNKVSNNTINSNNSIKNNSMNSSNNSNNNKMNGRVNNNNKVNSRPLNNKVYNNLNTNRKSKINNTNIKTNDKSYLKFGVENVKLTILGGMGEVGKNSYALEIANDIFIIDYGVLFPSEEYVGVDYIIPNFSYLKENENKIKGLFITHGHEDHIGGIPFLLKKVKVPNIYAPKMSKFLIEKKLKEHKLTANIIEINDDSNLKINKNVTIHTFHQTHSIPNSLGLFFETVYGNVVTTGDFKIDFSPAGEERTDFARITELANKGVDLLLADSTNSLKSGFSESSSEIGDNLKLLLKEAPGRILFTTFASHINRVQKIIEGAIEDNRKVCVLGRSMKNNIKIGIKAGYINLRPHDLIDLKNVTQYAPEEVCIISTGSQGEELAALSRIANGLNPHLELSEEDTVVFASNPIPGNRYNIGIVIDKLYKTKCKVIINSSDFKTHTSGHASKEEQKLMLSLFNPRYFLPIHGTYNMLLAHKYTGQEIGIAASDIFILDNGDSLIITSKNRPRILKRNVPGKSIFVSGNNINVSLEDSNMNQIASNGLLIMSVLLDKNRKLVSYPQITTRGFVIISEEIDLLRQIQRFFTKLYTDNMLMSEEKLEGYIVQKLSKYIQNKIGKNPYISLNIIKYNPTLGKEEKVKKLEGLNKKEVKEI